MADFVYSTLGIPLGSIIYYAYSLTGSYGIAIIIFTAVIKIIFYPLNIMTHKNSIRLLQLQPKLNNIKRRYSGEREQLNEARYELFKKEKYSPFLGIIPLFIQLFLLMGILRVMYHPLEHMLRLNQDVIGALTVAVRDLYGTQGGTGEQLLVIEAVHRPENLRFFQSALTGFANSEQILHEIMDTNLYFLGVNLGAVPSFDGLSPEVVVVFITGIAALSLCIIQSFFSPGAMSQGKKTNWGFTLSTVGVMTYIVAVTPAGVGVYWIVKKVIDIANIFVLRAIYNPRKLAAEALEQIKASRKTSTQLREERLVKKELRVRENADAKRFTSAKKQLVFYAVSSGQYKYYKKIIEYILDNSTIVVHYLTSDPNDSLFKAAHERLIPYYASQKKCISLFLKLDTDIMATTVSGLGNYHMRRSVVRDDIEYISIPHTLLGSFALVRKSSSNHFDTFFCVNAHRLAAYRRYEAIENLSHRKMVKVGYGLYDQLIESYKALTNKANEKPQILIAPSWQADNIMELCIDNMLESLLGNRYIIYVRPHPQYSNMFSENMQVLTERYSKYVTTGEIVFEMDFSSNESIFMSDVLITDWSTIAFEFSYCSLRPSIFINTPMKVLNTDYSRYEPELLHVALRNVVGLSVDVADVVNINETVTKVLAAKDEYKEAIRQVVEQHLFYPGRSGEAGGMYILNQIKASENKMEASDNRISQHECSGLDTQSPN